jgi:hypothetical protein
MSDSIRKQILDQIYADLAPLKDHGTIRTLKLSRFPGIITEVKGEPYVHIMGGNEVKVGQDFRGYIIQMDVHIAVAFNNLTQSESRMEPVIDAINLALEADEQLTPAGGTPLASWIYYSGLEFFQSEVVQGQGGVQLTYQVEYRRQRGTTTVNY